MTSYAHLVTPVLSSPNLLYSTLLCEAEARALQTPMLDACLFMAANGKS